MGKGQFGKVYKGRCRDSSVAVKVPKNQNLTTQELEDFRREVAIMSKIFHPNVVLFMGACTQPGNIKIVTERMTTDLESLLLSPKGKTIPTIVRMKMARDAAKGMSWLHGISNIIHRDLKPANLLVDQSYNVKVTDFGFSEVLKGETTKDTYGPRGTVLWMSPEVMNNEEFDKTIDVYAFGIILWQIYTLQEPFTNYEDLGEFKHAICVKGERPVIPPHDPTQRPPRPTPQSLVDLLSSCWNHDRRKRPSFSSIVNSINLILVDLIIDDPLAALFWKNHFFSMKQDLEEVVWWRGFVAGLAIETGIKDKTRFDVLHPYLATFGSEAKKVTIFDFNQSIHWFGCYYAKESAEETLQEIKKLTSKVWFHGFIDQYEADGRLSRQPPGAFLVRLSKTYSCFPFTLSLSAKKHLRIKKSNGEFSIEMKNYTTKHKTLIELIEAISNVFDPPLTISCPQTPAPHAYEDN
uniref:SH2 domain-containing protein n=1 Tax=Arcella intermedia TaxID=1963864 RepID=A0A6B2L315_9EUKA